MDGMASMTTDRPAVTAPPANRRRLILSAVIVTVLGVLAYYAYGYITTGRFFETTDDAYIQADMVTVSARVAGQVGAVAVGDNQTVRAGDVLVQLDDRDLQVAVAQAAADIASAEADITALRAQIQAQSSAIQAADADVTVADSASGFARAETQRYSDLVRTGTGSIQRAQQADADAKGRQASAARARAGAQSARQQIAVLAAQLGRANAALMRARAAQDQAKLNLSYATIKAPSDGAVGDRTVRAGQYVQPGTRLLNVVPMQQGLYVTANYKETQLAEFCAGQEVTLTLDMLGGRPFRGVVDSLAPGSGSTFALLPPENATGNFTKIVQRVPVRIRLLPDARLAQLRPGLSVTAGVDTRTACAAK